MDMLSTDWTDSGGRLAFIAWLFMPGRVATPPIADSGSPRCRGSSDARPRRAWRREQTEEVRMTPPEQTGAAARMARAGRA